MQTITERPADSAGEIAPGLAVQQQARETSLQKLARLRNEASAEIDRLLSFLDASDEYVQTECETEDEGDDNPDDEVDLTPGYAPNQDKQWKLWPKCDPYFHGDGEDDDESEPSLASSPATDQTDWHMGRRDDREEDAGDECEPDEDGEPSLGATEAIHHGAAWRQAAGWSSGTDLEAD
jgi:hypothetical protein